MAKPESDAAKSPEKSPEKSPKSKNSTKADLAAIIGVVVAVGGLVGGLMMEGGKITDILQISSGLIVLCGTIGAVMITTPLGILIRAVKRFGSVFFSKAEATDETIEEIIEYATQARKNGIVSLEQRATEIDDPFLKKALGLAVDGIDTDKLRDIMELEIQLLEQRSEQESKVFEAAGGYAPTIGILGAVMGLIQVMKNLANIDEVGRGIAVAFVATLYGVGSANLVFLPAANKLKARAHELVQLRELMLEGVLSIAEGLNQKLIRIKLEAYSPARNAPAKAAKAVKAKGSASEPVSAEG